MAKNMFINTTGLEIEKSMPSLIGMDFSGVVQSKSNIDLGKTISNFADKYKKIEQTNNTIKIQNKMNEMENQWQLENMSDPNVLMTNEGRQSIGQSYNNLIEQKKKLLIDAKGQFDSDTYLKLEGYFKNQTYDSLYKLQYKTNTAYIKETTDDVLLSTKLLVDNIALSDNEEERNMLAENGLKNIQELETLGVDTREMCLNFITTTQQKSLEYEVERNIMNNNTNEAFFMTDEQGNFIYDNQGNAIIDNGKKMKALNDLYDGFLSDAAIMDAAKSISKTTNIKVEDAFNVIKNIRQTNIKAHRQYNESILGNREQNNKYAMLAFQQKVENAGISGVKSMNDAMNKGRVLDGVGIATGRVIDATNISELDNIYRLTNGKYDNAKDILNDNQYIPLLVENDANWLKNTPIKDSHSYNNVKSYLNNMLKDTDPSIREMYLLEIQDKIGIPYNTLAQMVMPETQDKISDDDISSILSAQNNQSNPTQDLAMIHQGYFGNKKTFFADKDPLLNMAIYKDLMQNPTAYLGNDIPLDAMRNGKIVPDKILEYAISYYNSNKQVSINNRIAKVKSLIAKKTGVPMSISYGENSLLYKTAWDTATTNEIKKQAVSYVKKSPESVTKYVGEKIGTNVTSNKEQIKDGELDVIKESLLSGTQLFNNINPQMWADPRYKEMGVDVFIQLLNEGKVKDSDLPLAFKNDPRINKYYEQKILTL